MQNLGPDVYESTGKCCGPTEKQTCCLCLEFSSKPSGIVYGQHLTELFLFVLRSYGDIPGPREGSTTQLPILAKPIPLFSILWILFGT